MSINIVNISKKFGSFEALKDINLTINTGELVALLGPSGSGKTTLLRIIAGLEYADAGEILINEREMISRKIRERKVGFVFQHYALFRNMTVFENVAFGLKVRPRGLRPPKNEITGRVHELLRLVQLESHAERYPRQLSGGQRQRVALARALAVEPSVLLLDEPFGALDARVRIELRRWLRKLHDELHITSVFVTHDQDEALEVADKVVVMNAGRIEQTGGPEEVYDNPASPFVFNFLGAVNIFHGRVHDGCAHIGSLKIDSREHVDVPDTMVVGYVRSHDIDIGRTATGGSSIPARVRTIHRVGNIVRVELLPDDGQGAVEAEITRDRLNELNLQEGEGVHIRPKKVKVFIEDYQI
ncbi:MAG: sulfate ABC transporter [Spirochaetes bacterium RBG_16_49_21]|nr:MAG: sulfate ABC transporter [Spirochaetes bacterium RBG_16_49_21]